MVARKSKHQVESAAATLDELESRSERLADWISNNPTAILGTAAAILVIAAIYGFATSSQDAAAEKAAASLATVQSEYRKAMGAGPSDFEIPEPANADTALAVRTEYLERFISVASEHQGTSTAALAALDAGQIQDQLGNPGEARATWQAGADGLPAESPIRALLLLRVAGSFEEEENWSEAAASYEEAAAVPAFPLRHTALLDASRCRAQAGEVDQALANYAMVEEEAPDQVIPQDLSARVAELRASR